MKGFLQDIASLVAVTAFGIGVTLFGSGIASAVIAAVRP